MFIPIAAKKSLGQHFLKDADVAQRIVNCMRAESGCVLEVGAGMGALTQRLLQRADIQLYAVETDSDAITYLAQHFPELGGRLLHMDFLRLDISSAMSDRCSIIGNFPYNISSQILFKILEQKNMVGEVVCMLQKEVAMRLAAPAGSRDSGILSVLLQAYYDVEYLFSVDASVFVPQPKVQSGVIRLQRNDTERLPCDEDLFRRIVKTSFNQRRKTLRNSLRSLLGSPAMPHPLLSMRPEQLTISDFAALTNAVQAAEKSLPIE
jgi:16S rRNA (adenine1518-N6/adenine1519-N6)-dimethyltransferase